MLKNYVLPLIPSLIVLAIAIFIKPKQTPQKAFQPQVCPDLSQLEDKCHHDVHKLRQGIEDLKTKVAAIPTAQPPQIDNRDTLKQILTEIQVCNDRVNDFMTYLDGHQ